MSGTSMDGLDLAYCSFWVEEGRYRFRLEQAETIPFEARWRSRLAFLPQQSAEVFAKTHVFFGHWLGKNIREFVSRYQLSPQYVAVHGQTIFHQPDKSFTTQIGDGETIATYLNCPIVTNFRNKDVALKGEGAPLIILGEQLLFDDYRLFLNLGGIANLTYESFAFDTCPCNGVLNEVFKFGQTDSELDYDEGGQLAATGSLHMELFEQLNRLAYYRKAPPKTLGWEWVADQVLPLLGDFDLSTADILNTLVEHIAFQIARAADKVGAEGESMLITGGGRHHTYLMERLTYHLSTKSIEVIQDIPPVWIDYKEAIVFAFLGLRTLKGEPATVSSATGATQAAVSGSIHLPVDGGGLSLL